MAFKIIAILHNTLLATFIKLLETVSKGLFRNRSQNRCHPFLDCRHACKTCAFHDALQVVKQKEVHRRQIRGVRWMIENRYAALSRELVDTDRTVHRCVRADPNVAHPQLFPSRHETIWTSCKHIFCPRLPSHTLAPTFHASQSLFSLICSRTLCSLVATLHCDHTSHTDYVRLPTTGLPCRSHILYTRWCFSAYLWIAMCMRANLAHVAVEISDHSPNFLDTPRTALRSIINNSQIKLANSYVILL